MKTIAQIANEIGVSKQAVQKRISREPLYTKIQPYISTIHGTKYIVDIGEILIKSAYGENVFTGASIDIADNQPPDVHSKSIDYVSQVNSELIKLLRGQLEMKDRQLEARDKQIEELTKAISCQAESINADRKTDLLGQMLETQNRLLLEQTSKKKDIMSRFNRWVKGNTKTE